MPHRHPETWMALIAEAAIPFVAVSAILAGLVILAKLTSCAAPIAG